MTQDIDQLAINTIRTLSIDAVAEGELGTSRDADGAGAGRLRALAEPPALRPGRPDLAQPRPLRALGRPRLDAALLDALPGRGAAGRRRLQGARRAGLVSLHEIEEFRQLHSRTPGHPEYRWTSGVETTTGPLGQGIATSVGMALASKWQGERFGRRRSSTSTSTRWPATAA